MLVRTGYSTTSQRQRDLATVITAIATRIAQPTCTDGMAESSSAWNAAVEEYTDCPYRAAVSTMPIPDSNRGGATGTNWMSRQIPMKATRVILKPPYRSLCHTNSHTKQA